MTCSEFYRMPLPPVDTDRVIVTGALLGTLAGLGVPVLLQLRVGYQVLVGLERGRREGGRAGDMNLIRNFKTTHTYIRDWQ